MTKYIRFQKNQKFYILKDFKEDVLKKISNEMFRINRELRTNKFNFYSIEDFISLESFKGETLENIKKFSFNIEFINLQIDSEKHDIKSTRVMHRDPLESFKSLYLNTILTSKVYNIEKYVEEDIIKIEGLKDNINLKDIYFKYDIR
ncbi:TPA: hypothetical protein ACT5CK_002340 [Flavobacterium psychrophilum]|uniref:hypothetical protein n=1 Tax=Flavobacterium psychrophilum TaxID=96345 RepID=UPI00073EAF41|nr:hypothetical protein [Flavobacterium psychrophilum]SNB96789.1 hypothetical protein FPC840_2680006 [Flavobacterium psychrophilum]GAQ50129.1 hypothetical protein FPK15_contig00108-0002 [Flavobacterium psychrophilum]GAW90766.1 hypothetical protein FPS14_contig00105-0001 [Flavobacterium psychrophilum]GEJ30973.1 hypothetical protein FPN186_contig00129-0003 [Flavobacterium psychrophilum]GEJ33832.1 hypothetical protein FPN185_contig00086-0002 [Flavobacterium psychrophilum]